MSAELNTLVREVAADHPQADPREIARHVAKLTPDDSVTAFYEEALVRVVTDALRSERNHALNKAMSAPSGRVSPKVAGVRDWWKSLCESRVHVGDSSYKLLGDCDQENLQFCIAERAEFIARTQAQIDKYQRLVELLTEHGVTYVRELPPEAVQQ